MTLAVVVVLATSAATANAQTAIEYALMSGFVASVNGGPEIEAARAGKPTDASGAFVYRKGRYTPLDTVPDQPMTGHVGFNDRGQVVGAYPGGASLRA